MEGQELVEMNLPQLRVLRLLVYILQPLVRFSIHPIYHKYTGSLSTDTSPDAAMSLAESGKTYCLLKKHDGLDI